jgi:hypothetical protein
VTENRSQQQLYFVGLSKVILADEVMTVAKAGQTKTKQMIRLSLDRPTGNFWVDTGLVVLIQRFGEGEHNAQGVLEWVQGQLLQKSGNKGEYYDPSTKQVREYEKVNWTYPTNLFIKVSGQPAKVPVREALEELQERLKQLETEGRSNTLEGKKIAESVEYLTARLAKKEDDRIFTEPPTFRLSLELSKKPGACDLCGEIAPLTDAKMWMYPFIVDPQKFGTFYSGNRRGLKLCARCAIAGLAGYLGWLWKAQGRDALHFFIFHSELREMKRLHEEVLQPLMAEAAAGRGGTAPTEFAGPYIHETTLGLLLALFAHVRQSDQLSEPARLLLAQLLGASEASVPTSSITLYAVTGTPGKAFNMQALREFSKLQRLYRLYEEWVRQISGLGIDANPHRRLVHILGQFWAQQGQNRETIWRDKIAQAILEFGDPLPFVEQFLFEVRAKEENRRPLLRGTLDVLNHYVREVLHMDEQFQRTLAGFGHSLGIAAQQNNEMGLLYALRNAKNPEEFYRVLNDVQFRLQITIPESLLRIEKGERIAGVPWVRVKTLLSIYAMNAYLRKASAQEEETPSQEG